MTDDGGAGRSELRWFWGGNLAAFIGLAVLMVRVPAGMSGAERNGLWCAVCGAYSVLVLLKSWKSD